MMLPFAFNLLTKGSFLTSSQHIGFAERSKCLRRSLKRTADFVTHVMKMKAAEDVKRRSTTLGKYSKRKKNPFLLYGFFVDGSPLTELIIYFVGRWRQHIDHNDVNIQSSVRFASRMESRWTLCFCCVSVGKLIFTIFHVLHVGSSPWLADWLPRASVIWGGHWQSLWRLPVGVFATVFLSVCNEKRETASFRSCRQCSGTIIAAAHRSQSVCLDTVALSRLAGKQNASGKKVQSGMIGASVARLHREVGAIESIKNSAAFAGEQRIRRHVWGKLVFELCQGGLFGENIFRNRIMNHSIDWHNYYPVQFWAMPWWNLQSCFIETSAASLFYSPCNSCLDIFQIILFMYCNSCMT